VCNNEEGRRISIHQVCNLDVSDESSSDAIFINFESRHHIFASYSRRCRLLARNASWEQCTSPLPLTVKARTTSGPGLPLPQRERKSCTTAACKRTAMAERTLSLASCAVGTGVSEQKTGPRAGFAGARWATGFGICLGGGGPNTLSFRRGGFF
jgi:hypothetical protein